MNICILNASNPKDINLESDEYVDLRSRKDCFEGNKVVKQCRSWHSWAYALGSEYFVYNKQGWPGVFKYDGVVVLVNRDIHLALPLITKLKAAGKKVAVSFHEGVQDLLITPGQKWIDLRLAVELADFYVNIFGQYQAFFEGWFGKDKVKFVNHTAPFDWDHGLSIPWRERTGDVLCGTRTFNQRLSRNTFITLATLSGWAKENPGRKIDYITEDGTVDHISGIIQAFGLNNITVHQGPLEYNKWLNFLANYKYVCHMDTSSNLSQIVFDCVMLDVLCIGSTGWLNQELGSADGGSSKKMLEILKQAPFSFWKRAQFHPEKIKRDLLEIFE